MKAVVYQEPYSVAVEEVPEPRIEDPTDVVIKVTGHADAIGSDQDNQSLSERRAETVRDVLVQSGVTAPIGTEGMGARKPVKTCDDLPRDALVACLAPNRRVEVSVEGVR